jgi:hypothetical protein
MAQYGINSVRGLTAFFSSLVDRIPQVRIPLGFWIIESTVNSGESYPQGGLNYLVGHSADSRIAVLKLVECVARWLQDVEERRNVHPPGYACCTWRPDGFQCLYWLLH